MINYLNTEKGDTTPYKWLPPINELRYISNWIAVKYRYDLKLSINEFNILHKILDKYKEFIPDEPIKNNEEKGNSLQISNTILGKEKLLTNHKNSDLIRSFIDNYSINIFKACGSFNIKNEQEKINMENLRNILKENNNHSYFGLLRPEIVDIISDDALCNLFKYN